MTAPNTPSPKPPDPITAEWVRDRILAMGKAKKSQRGRGGRRRAEAQRAEFEKMTKPEGATR